MLESNSNPLVDILKGTTNNATQVRTTGDILVVQLACQGLESGNRENFANYAFHRK